MDRYHALAILFCVILLSGCSSDDSESIILPEDGVPVTRTLGGPKYNTPLFELEHDLFLGIEEGEPAWQVFDLNPHLLTAPDGTMVLVDPKALKICIVSSTGELLHQLGGEGSGPGEFLNILDVFWAEPGAEFWLSDQFNNRITKYSIDGTYLGSVNYSEIRSRWTWFKYLGNRQFMVHDLDRDPNDPYRRITRYAIMNDQLEIVRNLPTLGGPRYYQATQRSTASLPWTAYSIFEVTPAGRMLMVQPDHPRLTIYSSSAEPLLHIERDWELVAVTEREKQDYRQYIRDRYPEADIRSIQFPDHKPPFQWAFVDSEGRIWLRMYEAIREESVGDEPGELIGFLYEIYGSDGTWLGTHVSQDYIIAVTNGYFFQMNPFESGAPRLERLSIIPLVPEMETDPSR